MTVNELIERLENLIDSDESVCDMKIYCQNCEKYLEVITIEKDENGEKRINLI